MIHFRRPGKTDDSWCPTILGIQKRDLVKEVLAVFGEDIDRESDEKLLTNGI